MGVAIVGNATCPGGFMDSSRYLLHRRRDRCLWRWQILLKVQQIRLSFPRLGLFSLAFTTTCPGTGGDIIKTICRPGSAGKRWARSSP
jgi:hypothetical protein